MGAATLGAVNLAGLRAGIGGGAAATGAAGFLTGTGILLGGAGFGAGGGAGFLTGTGMRLGLCATGTGADAAGCNGIAGCAIGRTGAGVLPVILQRRPLHAWTALFTPLAAAAPAWVFRRHVPAAEAAEQALAPSDLAVACRRGTQSLHAEG